MKGTLIAIFVCGAGFICKGEAFPSKKLNRVEFTSSLEPTAIILHAGTPCAASPVCRLFINSTIPADLIAVV